MQLRTFGTSFLLNQGPTGVCNAQATQAWCSPAKRTSSVTIIPLGMTISILMLEWSTDGMLVMRMSIEQDEKSCELFQVKSSTY